MLEVNQILQHGRYRILEQIGQDETGLSYQAYDNFLKANVALREISMSPEKGLLHDKQGIGYAKKAKKLTQIKHDSLLNVHDCFSEIDRQYLVLELVEGDLLSELIEKKKRQISLEEFIKWADQLLDAVSCLQNRIPSIIHSEIKPQNLQLTSNGRIKLLTFGIGKQNEQQTQNPDSAELSYLPLEQIWEGLDSTSKQFILRDYDERSERVLEQALDVRSDIYSVGATLYYVATGKRPIDALERSIDILEGKTDPLQPVSKLNPAIPAEISNIVMKAMEIKRENRFNSALTMQSILRGTIIRLKPQQTDKVREEVTASLKASSVEKDRLRQEQQLVRQQKLEIKSEQTEQLEIKTNEIREQEPFIEPPVVEAEKQNFEEEKHVLIAEEISDENEKSEGITSAMKVAKSFEEVQAELISDSKPKIENNYAVRKNISDEDDDIFTVPEKESSSLRWVLAVAAVALIVGGAGWGIWTMQSSNPANSGQNLPNQTVSSSDTALPKPEAAATPAPSVAPAPETNLSTIPSESTVAEKPVSQPAIKNRPPASASSSASAKKTVASSKSPTEPKKVTVDDLINDN